MKKGFSIFTDPDTEEQHRSVRIIWLTLLLLAILAAWGVVLNFGDIPFDFHDWAEVNAPRLAFLKDAVTKGKLPLHMPDSSALRGVTDRYLALPDMILSPQVLLLRFMSVGTFVLVHTWMMIGLGYWGLLRLKKRFSLSLLSFTWIAILFFCNGHMISHYAVGHVTWGGTFLLSWFAELVFALIEGDRSARWEAKMAFLLFFIFLQGSFHQFVWCVIFLGFLAVSDWKTFFPILRSGIAAGLLSAVRIIPPAMQMGAFDDDFLGGYRSPVQLVNAFIKIITPADSLNQQKTGAVLGWWEFDLYTGLAGVILLALALLAWLMIRSRQLGFPSLICPVAVLSLFSVRNVYSLMRFFRIPLFSGERVSSRFLILPFIFILIAGAAALQRFLERRTFRTGGYMLLSLAVIPLTAGIGKHLDRWKVTEAVKGFPYTYTDLSIKIVANHPDRPYTTGLLIGAAVSVLSGILILVRAKKSRD
ncbi:MAG: hypothetical protein IJI07_10450 [Flexilinea sp.]|nr:hypothetical protein [Flexilinea sp.]